MRNCNAPACAATTPAPARGNDVYWDGTVRVIKTAAPVASWKVAQLVPFKETL